MKTITLGIIATIIVASLQMVFLGINGLTLVSIPLTIFLGLEMVEKLTERKQKLNN